MGEKLSKVIRSGPFWVLAVLIGLVALGFGFRFGLKDDARIEISGDSEKILAAEVEPGFIDEEAGSYRGVAIGDPGSVVRQKMGEPLDDNFGIFVPQLAVGKVWSGMGTFPCPTRGGEGWRSWAYREAVFEVVGGKVCSIQVGGSGWTTSGGIGGGDPMSALQDRGQAVECYETGGYENPDYDQPMCEVITDSGVKLSFGGDPVTSVTMLSRRKSKAAQN